MSDSDLEMNEVELFDALLDTDLDQIEDLPEFERFPVGIYQFKCEKGEVKIDPEAQKAAITGMFSLVSVIEVAEDQEENVPKEGSLLGGMWGKEFGIKKFKKVFLICMQDNGCTKTREFVDMMGGMEFILKVGTRLGKPDDLDEEGKRKVYNEIQMSQMA